METSAGIQRCTHCEVRKLIKEHICQNVSTVVELTGHLGTGHDHMAHPKTKWRRIGQHHKMARWDLNPWSGKAVRSLQR